MDREERSRSESTSARGQIRVTKTRGNRPFENDTDALARSGNEGGRSVLMGIDTLLGQREAGEIDDAQFVDLALMVAAESALTCIAAVAGQTLIPVPMLGAFVGSVAGKLVESALRGSLGDDTEAELLERLQAYETEAIAELDESLCAAVREFDVSFGRLEHLMGVAFDETVNTQMRLTASLCVAESTGVPADRILRSTGDVDAFMEK